MEPGCARDVTVEEIETCRVEGVVRPRGILYARVRYRFHRSAPPQPHHQHALADGDPIECAQSPLVWSESRA